MDDQFNLDFSLRSNQLSRTFSTSSDESFQGPATPPSGRSTPGLFPPTDQGNMVYGTLDMGTTPSASTFGPFPTDALRDGPHCLTLDPMLYEPAIITPQFDFPQQEFPQVFPQQAFPQQDYTMGDYYNNMPSWPWTPEDGSPMFFDGPQPKMPSQTFYPPYSYQPVPEQTTALQPVQGRLQDRPPRRAAARAKREQEPDKTLGRVKGPSRINKRNKMPKVIISGHTDEGTVHIEADLCGKSQFHCPYIICSRPFVRKEHQKRHVRTVHLGLETIPCELCGYGVNRHDNLITHIITHMNRSGKGRSVYYEEAIVYYLVVTNELQKGKRKTQRRLNEKQEATVKDELLHYLLRLEQNRGAINPTTLEQAIDLAQSLNFEQAINLGQALKLGQTINLGQETTLGQPANRGRVTKANRGQTANRGRATNLGPVDMASPQILCC
ncbi:hypothetical protein GGR58DRAFT_506272 [Xylaria digitata]|nr:hypothetical protein GGR58DRAFT_506272 [Xylaria digitata]